MGASAAELPPPGDTSVSDASAASVAATATTTQLTTPEQWLLGILRRNKFKGDFEKFDELLPLLPKILGIEANDLAAIEQAVSTADSASEAAAAAAGAAAADTSVAGTEKPVWLNFKPTPIRNDITPEIIERIFALRHTNRFFRKQSEPYINMLTEQLVALVLNGREDEAKALIEACPYLLERRATVTDPVGRVYEDVTAFEAALYAGDTQMCDMMAPFFKTKMDNEQKWADEQIRLGRDGFKSGMDASDIRLRQCRNVFPDGVQAVVYAQQTYDFSDVIDAIHKATAKDVTRQLKEKVVIDTDLGRAINQFRNDFAALSKQEKHANLKHLIETFRAFDYDIRTIEWRYARDDDKFCVFWRQVIGFVQLYLPECDKQAFYQSFSGVIGYNIRLSREVDFKLNRGASLHILEDFSGCGFDLAANFVAQARGEPGGLMPFPVEALGKLMSNKSIKLGEIMPPPMSRWVSCVIL